MYRLLYIVRLFLLLLPSDLSAQQANSALNNYNNTQHFMEDANGWPLYVKTQFPVEGNPFFPDSFCTASLQLQNGKLYTGICVQIDLQQQRLLYDAGNGITKIAVIPIARVVFNREAELYPVWRAGISGPGDETGSIYYQLLDSGRVMLLKKYQIRFQDVQVYGQNNFTRVFTREEKYYLYTEKKGLVPLIRTKESILSALPEMPDGIYAYMKLNKLSGRNEDEILAIVKWYNTHE